MAGVTTFEIFKNLLLNAVNGDSSLDTATRASMVTRVNELPREMILDLTVSNAESVQGSVSKEVANVALLVTTGSSGNNRVTWEEMEFPVPVQIDGTVGVKGFLPGHSGEATDPQVDVDDVSVQYRLGSSDDWKAFTRNTVLHGVSKIQFAADIADQGSESAMPNIHIRARQE